MYAAVVLAVAWGAAPPAKLTAEQERLLAEREALRRKVQAA
jgi:hypothetical protein